MEIKITHQKSNTELILIIIINDTWLCSSNRTYYTKNECFCPFSPIGYNLLEGRTGFTHLSTQETAMMVLIHGMQLNMF